MTPDDIAKLLGDSIDDSNGLIEKAVDGSFLGMDVEKELQQHRGPFDNQGLITEDEELYKPDERIEQLASTIEPYPTRSNSIIEGPEVVFVKPEAIVVPWRKTVNSPYSDANNDINDGIEIIKETKEKAKPKTRKAPIAAGRVLDI